MRIFPSTLYLDFPVPVRPICPICPVRPVRLARLVLLVRPARLVHPARIPLPASPRLRRGPTRVTPCWSHWGARRVPTLAAGELRAASPPT